MVLVENPSYLAALQSFGFAGARLVAVACDEDGLDPEALPALIAEHAPKFLYIVPTFQNPTGRTLPAARRARLAQRGRQHGLWIVEDDPYGELRYDGEPLAPIGAHAGAADRTVTISSLSKVLAPGLRIGWLRAPAPILGPLTIAKQAADLHTSTVDQMAARTSLQAADLDLHIANLCREYRRRRDALLDGLADALPPGSTFNRPAGRDVRLGASARGLGCGAAPARGARARRRVRPGASLLRRRSRPAHAAPVVHDARSGGDRRGAGAAARLLVDGRMTDCTAGRGDQRRRDPPRSAAQALRSRRNPAARPVSWWTDGVVRVNGEIETRRGRQLHSGDVVEVDGERVRVA